jgi:hypothetical protein
MPPPRVVTPVVHRRCAGLALTLCLTVLACDDDAMLVGEPGQGEQQMQLVGYECAPTPSACPAEVPSYGGEIAGIIERHCGNCHLDDNLGGPWPFTQRQDIVDWLSSVRSAVELCLMPPPESDAPLSPVDREKLQSWLACGAPDN